MKCNEGVSGMRFAISILRALIAVLKIGLILSIFLTGYTVFSILGSSLSSLTKESSFDTHINPDGSLGVSSSIEVNNGGYLASTVSAKIRILIDGEKIAEGEDTLYLKSGDGGKLEIDLSIPREDLSRLMKSRPETEIYLDIRTLNNLTGISLKTEVSE